MAHQQFDILLRKLDLIVRLLALSRVAGKKQSDQVVLLSEVGFEPKEIAQVLGKDSHSVRAVLSSARRKSKKRRR